jgi:hypothetical protein
MVKKQSTSKQEFFHEIWGHSAVEVTRVEFQLRREILKEFQKEDKKSVDSIEDLYGALGSLWDYSVLWCKQARKEVDRENKNQSQIKLSDFWKVVIEIDFPSENDFTRAKRPPSVDVKALIKQAAGCMMSAVASLGIDVQEKDNAYHISDIISESRYLLINSIIDTFNDDPWEFFRNYKRKQINAMPAFT